MNESTITEERGQNEDTSERPVVVSIIAVAMLLNGIITLVTGLLFKASPLALALGAAAVLLSLGLWKLWAWAWAGTILMQLVALGASFYDWYALGSIDFWSIGIAILIVLYLLRAEIRAEFFG